MVKPEREECRRFGRWSLAPAITLLGWGLLARAHSERLWPVAVLELLPPQVLLPLPLLGLWRSRRRPGWTALHAAVLGGLLCWPVGWVFGGPVPAVAGPRLRVLTLNTEFASASPGQVAALARREEADAVFLQEALSRDRQFVPYAAALRRAFPGWTLTRHDELVTLTRLPVLETRAVAFPGSPHALLLTRVDAWGQAVTLLNVHLPTTGVLPSASDRARRRTLPERVERRLAARRAFLERLGTLLEEAPGPVLLAGDLNASPRGELAARLRALGLSDAFARAGSGFGFTHAARFGHARIDYVWSRGAVPTAARVLPERLSDHRALAARLVLEQ